MNIGKINFVDTDIKFRQIQQSKNITQVKHEKKDDKNRKAFDKIMEEFSGIRRRLMDSK